MHIDDFFRVPPILNICSYTFARTVIFPVNSKKIVASVKSAHKDLKKTPTCETSKNFPHKQTISYSNFPYTEDHL